MVAGGEEAARREVPKIRSRTGLQQQVLLGQVGHGAGDGLSVTPEVGGQLKDALPGLAAERQPDPEFQGAGLAGV